MINGSTIDGLPAKLAVYFVADPQQTTRPLLEDVTAALQGGISSVQLRAKTLTDRELVCVADQINKLCAEAGALFFVNDRIDIALAVGADGVHLGVDDLPIEDARRIGGSLIIGYSPETDHQTAEAADRGANYLGVGPVFGTASKHDAGGAIGVETIARRVRIAGVPVIGIGGISATNASEVIESGAVGIAVVGAISRSSDPRAAAANLASVVHGTLGST